jgi:hypothetical protein
MGTEAPFFHGHNNALDAKDPYIRAYPLVQYAVRRGRATLIGLGEGADALRQELLPRLPDELYFAGRPRPILGMNMQEHTVEWGLLGESRIFGLTGWLALNADNYKQWKTSLGAAERFQLLSRALTGHLRALAERFEVPHCKNIQANILRIDKQKKMQWHGTPLVRFNVLAEANLTLPNGVGIGRAAAFGFGELHSEIAYEHQLSFTQRGGVELLKE